MGYPAEETKKKIEELNVQDNTHFTGMVDYFKLPALELDILPVGSGEIEKMMELAAKYKNENIALRDIVHASAMLTNNIKKIIFADRDFDRIEEIQRIYPGDF